MKYIESTTLPDGTYDHTEVRAAAVKGYKIQAFSHYAPFVWFPVDARDFDETYKYRATIPDTYGIHESSSTLSEVKGDAGPAVAEMLLDRIKELEGVLSLAQTQIQDMIDFIVPSKEDYDVLTKIHDTLNKEPK